MSIDGYEHNFKYLCEIEFPAYLAKINESALSQRSMDNFTATGQGVFFLIKKFELQGDFSGCYVLFEKDIPIYVGISRAVIRRLRQHVQGKTHFDASLAYLLAKSKFPHQKTRADAMNTEKFEAAFNDAKIYIRKLHVAFVEIKNPFALYVFEPYCALHFGTSKWNSFQTH